MNTCPNCGKVSGFHSSILQGCMCQYSAPPQRTWVGLDHQDKKKFSSWLDHKTDDEVFTAIDDLLREMNT